MVQAVCDYCDVSLEEEVPQIKRYEKKQIELSPSLLKQIQSFYQMGFDVFEYDPEGLSFAEIGEIILV